MSYNMSKILSEESYENQVSLDLDIEEVLEFIEFFIFDSKNISILFPNETSNIECNKKPEEEVKTPNIDFDEENKNLIKIKKENNYIQFFLKARGHNPSLFKESPQTKIGDIIEEYIKIIGEKDEIKNSFFYREQKINNLESTIQELGITPLSFIVSNYVDN